MNERIKELEAQCWEPRQYGPAWFNSTKFAELIVRECADIADCTAMAFPVNGWVVGDKIRKHFGVEK